MSAVNNSYMKARRKRTALTRKGYRPQIRSRHPSHAPLRINLKRLPFRSVIRFGSSTELQDTRVNGGRRVELNTVEAIGNSSNKLLMKQCFTQGKVKTARWWTWYNESFLLNGNETDGVMTVENLPYPIIAKRHFGSRGQGNTKINNVDEMNAWIQATRNKAGFIFEVYHSFSREYRLHVNTNGCFYTCRKMLKRDTPEENKWFRNDSNSVWILEENPSFDKPVNWEEIVDHSVRALTSVGLDFGAVDLKVQSATQGDQRRDNCDFIVIEINSAPSFGEVTLERYKEVLPALLEHKYLQGI